MLFKNFVVLPQKPKYLFSNLLYIILNFNSMNFDETTHEAIRMYLTEQLSETATEDFEKKLLTNPDLAAEVRQWRAFRVVAKHDALLEQLSIWQNWGTAIDGTEPLNEYDAFLEPQVSKWQILRKWIWGGISLVVVISISVGGYQYQQKTTTQEHYTQISKQYTRSLPNFVAFAQGSDTTLKVLLRGYDAGDYGKVVQIFEKMPTLHSDKTAQLFAGVSALLDNQPQKCIELLTPLTAIQFQHADKALYYIGLAELRLGKLREARQRWLQLSPTASFKSNADSLLLLPSL
jgi:hypothetical protein